MHFRLTLLVALTAFAVTLAIIIGQRLNGEALAVVLGVAIGVGASLPGNVLLFRIANRTRSTATWPPPALAPRVLVVQTPASASRDDAAHAASLPASSPREFVVIGQDMVETESPAPFR